ncbi:SEC13 [Bugula neritina]|uniref:Protein SEC13 homolog n=1 Tax=Bugula neritina TaxID=10212 RepID=A0A7J7KQ02_BUGNE|nr:SEC13 [Bugula neritina]
MMSVMQTIDTAHDDMIHDAQMDYFGIKLATCSSDRAIRVFDVKQEQYTLQQELMGHEGPVWQLAWAHPKFGSILASCSYDKKVVIWKEINRKWSPIYEYKDHESSVNSVAWAPHEFGLLLACGSSDCSISLISSEDGEQWDSKRIQNAHSIGCNAVCWAPATSPVSLLETSADSRPELTKRLVSGGCDTFIKIWKEEDGEWVEDTKLEGHSDWVRDVAWAPATGLNRSQIASCSQDGRVIIWTNNGSTASWSSKELLKSNDVVWHASWSLTGNILAISGGDNKVTLWKEAIDGNWQCISDVSKSQDNEIKQVQG